ncbi:hypothetical protein [Sporosalibacterium faouarense]|uniref:hypothetical protein n=1 Tax=Sporosalibacterium faouarense TaxID=516123 RepID=UPI00192BBE95|nr:hypothetical protein [Sporosalibacterium faouarense]
MNNNKIKTKLATQGFTEEEIKEILAEEGTARVSFRASGVLKKSFELAVEKDIRFTTATDAYLYLMRRYIQEAMEEK